MTRAGVAIVGRTSDRTMTLRFSQSVVGRPKTIDFTAEATKPGCTRVSCVDTAPNAPTIATLTAASEAPRQGRARAKLPHRERVPWP